MGRTTGIGRLRLHISKDENDPDKDVKLALYKVLHGGRSMKDLYHRISKNFSKLNKSTIPNFKDENLFRKGDYILVQRDGTASIGPSEKDNNRLHIIGLDNFL